MSRELPSVHVHKTISKFLVEEVIHAEIYRHARERKKNAWTSLKHNLKGQKIEFCLLEETFMR